LQALRICGFTAETEYKFCENRKFKFDIIVTHLHDKPLPIKIAVEYEGGVFKGGRHVRPRGFVKDSEKYNLATIHGWRYFRYTPKIMSVTNGAFIVADDINKLLEKENVKF
jgi:hypothetical protein